MSKRMMTTETMVKRKVTGYIRNFIRRARTSRGLEKFNAEFMFRYLSTREINSLCRFVKERKELTASSDMFSRKDVTAGIDYLASALFEPGFYQPLLKKTETLLTAKLKGKDRCIYHCPLGQRLQQLHSTFSLDDNEIEFLLMSYLAQINRSLEDAADAVKDILDSGYIAQYSSPFASAIQMNAFKTLSGISDSAFKKIFRKTSVMRSLAMVDEDGKASNELAEYLGGVQRSSLSRHYFTGYRGEVLNIDEFPLDTGECELLMKMLASGNDRRSMNILLHGEPGTGKTEFARALGRKLGRTVYEVNPAATDEKDGGKYRYRALHACCNTVDPAASLIVMDEADHLLNTEMPFLFSGKESDKGVLNNVLENGSAPVIWITNHSYGMDRSTCRRFDFTMKFKPFTIAQRRTVWHTLVAKYKLKRFIRPDDIETLAGMYEINAGGIDVALRNCASLKHTFKTRQNCMDMVTTLLKGHVDIMGGDVRKRQNAQARTQFYSLDGLNISGNVARTVSMVSAFSREWQHDSRDASDEGGLNLLLWGPPGTGKTEFGRYVARHLERPLLVKKASDLMSKWVGDTEKQINMMFEQARDERSVLLVDEADSLLFSREQAGRSWEMSMVNEFLAGMESYGGIMVCATNFMNMFDSAAIRRFSVKLQFGYLKPDGIIAFYRRILGSLAAGVPDETAAAVLQGLDKLTPGDFKVVRQNFRFLPQEQVTHSDLVAALVDEVKHKHQYGLKKAVGF